MGRKHVAGLLLPFCLLAPAGMGLAETTPAPAAKASASTAPLLAEDMLEARLEEVRFDAKAPATIEVQFVLMNRSKKESVHLSERWNSWGNLQWSFTAKTAAGQELGFINRKDVWYKNYPSSFTIEPGKEFSCVCTLTLDRDFGKGMESRYQVCRFDEKSNPQPLDFEPAWTFPLKLTGRFTAVVNPRDEGGTTN